MSLQQELTPAQIQIVNDTHRFRVVNCGRRAGKTTLAAWEMFGFAVAEDGRRVAYYAPTRDDAREIVWSMLQKIGQEAIIYQNESRLEIKVRTQKGGESQIVLYGWESVQERGKGRGVRNDFIVLDEVAQYKNFWEGWHEVLRPTLTDTRGEALFISSPKGFNHFYDLFNLERVDTSYKSFHFTSYDNPFIPRDEIKAAQRELTEDRFAQEYLGDFRKMEGLVYKDFHRERHTYRGDIPVDKRTDVAEVLEGIDFGFVNPTAILPIYKGRNSIYYIDDEWVKSGKTMREIIEMAKSWGPHLVYPDPAEPDRIEEMTREGLYCMEVSKEIPPRIVAISQLFRLDRIKISLERCPQLISELETYHYPDKKPDKDSPELPVHENCDAINAMEYALYMNSGMSGRVSVPHSDGMTREFKDMLKRRNRREKDGTLFV